VQGLLIWSVGQEINSLLASNYSFLPCSQKLATETYLEPVRVTETIQSLRPFVTCRNTVCFTVWGYIPTPMYQTEEPHVVGCPPLLTFYFRSCRSTLKLCPQS